MQTIRNKQGQRFAVGFFLLGALTGLLFLAFHVSDFGTGVRPGSFQVLAAFDNVGDLKVRAPVTLAGVKIGEVTSIGLDSKCWVAQVTLSLDPHQQNIPATVTARILTQGLLGSNYISLTPGYTDPAASSTDLYLHQGSRIQHTESALILENLIGQLVFNMNQKSKE